MVDNKQYPISKHKEKELRKKGIVPFSRFFIPASLLTILFTLTTISIDNQTNLENASILLSEYLKSENVFNPDNNAIPGFYLIITCTLIFLFISVLLGLLQTGFLLLTPGRYPEGIKRNNKRITLYLYGTRLITITVLISCIGSLLYSGYNNWVLYNLELAHINYKNLGFYYSEIRTILYDTSFSLMLIFLIVSIIILIISKLAYLNTHRMSRDEILSERETRRIFNSQ
ncbi:MAG TPA: EscU/YscU/HrcU family type III secretion system export apparatus switch protein [Oligoflexia bacterium]|nr:EscU/YscU/HrcU family type III secretion system export apparatus switch protein [Oligoflexia bacterium]HMP47626.1 EscU/YscU/HrcU family type III secretion system export apparatus switch protein [Oligoflexia bacterium]